MPASPTVAPFYNLRAIGEDLAGVRATIPCPRDAERRFAPLDTGPVALTALRRSDDHRTTHTILAGCRGGRGAGLRVKPEATRSRIDALASFLPALAIAHAPGGGPECRARELQGAVVFADIAGFTALTERLAAGGPEGAEELTRHLNRVFGELTQLVAERGGDTVKFAGDALLALWVSEAERDLPHTVACAAGCALAIQQRIQGSEVGRALGLSLRLAVGAGRVAVAMLGGMSER